MNIEKRNKLVIAERLLLLVLWLILIQRNLQNLQDLLIRNFLIRDVPSDLEERLRRAGNLLNTVLRNDC